MQGFGLDSNGDVVIQKHKIVMVKGTDLTLQTIKTVLNTNKNEWFLNTDEGITFANILKKNPDYDEIKSEISEGLKQVDENLMIKDFSYKLNADRKLDIDFTATDGTEDFVYNSNTVNLNLENDPYSNDMTALIVEANEEIIS